MSDSITSGFQTIEQMEKQLIQKVVDHFGARRLIEAAKALGISRATLYRRMKTHNIIVIRENPNA